MYKRQPYILSGHLENFYRNKNVIDRFGRCLVFLGHSTTLNEILNRRTFDVNSFLNTYSVSWAINNLGISKNDIVTFDPNLLFEPDITTLIAQLNCVTNLNLNLKLCQDLHNIWWNNVILKIIN